MMAFGFGNRACLIDKRERRFEVGERKAPQQVMSVYHLPGGELLFESFEVFSGKRGDAAATGYTMLIREAHDLAPLPQRSQAPRNTIS